MDTGNIGLLKEPTLPDPLKSDVGFAGIGRPAPSADHPCRSIPLQRLTLRPRMRISEFRLEPMERRERDL